MVNKVRDKYKSEINNSPAQSKAQPKPSTKSIGKIEQDPSKRVAMQNPNDGYNFLSSLLQATLFFDYFEHVASKSFNGDRTDLKIIKLKATHPRFHSLALRFDFIARILAFLALFSFAVAVAGGSVWKVIFK